MISEWFEKGEKKMNADELELQQQNSIGFQNALQDLVKRQFVDLPYVHKFELLIAHCYMMSLSSYDAHLEDDLDEFLDVISLIVQNTKEKFKTNHIKICPKTNN